MKQLILCVLCVFASHCFSQTASEYYYSGMSKTMTYIGGSERFDYKGAIEDFTKAIELDPKDASAYSTRGYCKYKLKEYAGAVEDYNKAIKLYPENGGTYNERGNCKQKLGDKAGACSDWKKSYELGSEGSVNARDSLTKYCK